MPSGSRARVSRFPGVPDGKGKHAVETRKAFGTVLGPALEEDLGVRLGAEDGAPGFEVATELHVVIDLTVENHVPAAISRGHGLGSAGQIQDAQTAVAEAYGGIVVGPFRVGPAVGEATRHGRQRLFRGIRLVTECGEAGDAAHRSRFEDMARSFKRGG